MGARQFGARLAKNWLAAHAAMTLSRTIVLTMVTPLLLMQRGVQ